MYIEKDIILVIYYLYVYNIFLK